jgi:hypothetical protein
MLRLGISRFRTASDHSHRKHTIMPLPTAPTGLVATASTPATGSGQASVALSWTANPASEGIIEYRVYRSPTNWFMPKTVTAVVGTSCTDTAGELLANTGWYYFVVAVNAAGTSPASASASVTIPPALALPSAPAGLAATANDNDSISLSWSANPAAQDITGYALYREPEGASNATLVATVSSTAYTDSSSALTAGSSWSYYLTATNAAGTSPASSSVSITIPSATFLAPFQVSNYGTATVPAGAQVTFAQPFAPGDVPSTSSIQIRAADGATVLGSFQQDQESTWLQDGSTKCAAISFLSPDSFPPPAAITEITWADNVVTVTAPNHGLPSAGGLVNIQNVAQQPYDGIWTYTYVDANTFTYPLPAVTFAATTTAGSRVISAVPELGQNVNGMAITAATIPSGAISEGYGNTFMWSTSAATASQSSVAFTLSPPTPGTPGINDVMGNPHPATAALVIEYQIWQNSIAKNQAPNVTLSDITANSDIKLYFTDVASLDYLGGDTWEVSVNDIVANGHGAAWNPAGYDQTGWASTALTTTGTTVAGSNVITNLAFTAGLAVGQYVVDNNWVAVQTVPRGTQIAAINGANITVTHAATQSVTGLSLSFVNGPNRGWEVIRSGPACTEWRFWSHLRNITTGAWHPYLKGFVYLRCWGMNGSSRPIMEISGGWLQPNIWGMSPNSTTLNTNPTDVYISTNSADDFIFAAYAFAYGTNGMTSGSGWTMLPNSGQNSLITEYQIAPAALSHEDVTLTSGEGTQVGGIGDALVTATAGVAPSLDGSAHIQGGFEGSAAVTLSTGHADDVIVAVIWSYAAGGNQPYVTGISSPNLPASAWTLRQRITMGGPSYLDEWYAVAPVQLSGESITVNFASGGGSSFSVDVFAVSGAHTAAPFDTNAALPAIYPLPPENEYLMAVTLYDGMTALNSWGGVADPRVTTIDLDASPSPVTLSNSSGQGQIALSSEQYNTLLGQGGMRDLDSTGASEGRIPVLLSVSSGGSLPGGLEADTIYWVQSISGSYEWSGYDIGFATTAYDAWVAAGLPAYSSAGSGTMTITPLACSFPTNAGLALDPPTAGRTWRNGAKPTLLAGHDFIYLTQKSRALPPYLPTLKVNQTPAYAPPWSQGSQFWMNNLGGIGETLNDDRVSYVHYHATLELYRPFDIGYHQLNLGIAANWMEDTYHYHDETIGLIPVNNVTQYPDLGAPLGSDAYGQFTIGMAASPQTGGDLNGSQDFAPGSQHSPSPQMIPYLKTGDALWLESSLDDWWVCRAQATATKTIGDFTAYSPWNWLTFDPPETIIDAIFGNGRGQGWCGRSIGWAIHVIPASRPEHQFIRDAAAQDAQVPMLMVQNVLPAAMQWSGVYCDISALTLGSGPNPNGTYTQFACFMNGFQYQGWGMEAWRNEYPGWLEFFENYFYRWCPGFFDNTASTNGNYPEVNGAPQPNGCLWNSGIEALPIGFSPPVADGWYSSWDDCYNGSAYRGPYYDQGVVTQGSNQITGVSNSGPFGVEAQAFFVNGMNSTNTSVITYFPNYTCLENLSGSTLTVQAYPGKPGEGDATAGSGGSPVWLIYSWTPAPWPGSATVNSDPVLSNQLAYASPGGAPPNDPISYYNIHAAALALGSIFYSMTGNSVFANCTAIYNEIRRRQYPGSGPWDQNPFSLDGAPNFAFAPIGSTW